MSGVFKSLDQSDVRITPFRTYKLWNDSVGYKTYTAPFGSANQTQRLFWNLFQVNYKVSSSALYALTDFTQPDPENYQSNAQNALDPSARYGWLYKFEAQSDGTYNYVTNTDQAYGGSLEIIQIQKPAHVVTTTLTTVPAIAVYDSEPSITTNICSISGLRGDLTDAWGGNQVPIPSSSLIGQTVLAMDIGIRSGGSTNNVYLACNYGLWAIPVNVSNFNLASTAAAQPVHRAPYSGSYIGVLGSRLSALQQTIGLHIDVYDPLYNFTPGQLRFTQWLGYTAAGSTYVTSSVIEDTARYASTTMIARTMEAHNSCVYSLMDDDRLYMIITGSTTISPVSTYMDGVAAVISTRTADRTTDVDGNALPTHKVHIVTRDGFIILNPLPRKVGSTVVINQSNIIDCRQYMGVDKTVRVVTNLKNTTNENIHIIAGTTQLPIQFGQDTFGESISFVVNPNTEEISNVTHFGSLRADQITTAGGNTAIYGVKKELTAPDYGNQYLLYTSSLQGTNTTKWYKFDI